MYAYVCIQIYLYVYVCMYVCVRICVFMQARKAVPTDAQIWITAAKLEEAQGNVDNIDKVVSRAVKVLSGLHVR